MSNDQLDISGLFAWDDDLPRPHWNEVAKLVESNQAEARWDAWNAVVRQWLESLGDALDGAYEIVESDNFVALAGDAGLGQTVVRIAEQCRVALLSVLGELANFGGSGKDVVLLLRSPEEYYGYLDCFIPDGEYGGSAGMHIRDGLPHVALWGAEIWMIEPTLAHELTHVCLYQTSNPQWLEEGLAQMFERDIVGFQGPLVDAEMARRQQRFWRRCGLAAFWGGAGFSHRGLAQQQSYQLAEILVRVLLDVTRDPRFDNGRERLLGFLRHANESDGGEEACLKHLGFSLGHLASHFLGPGSWSPEPD